MKNKVKYENTIKSPDFINNKTEDEVERYYDEIRYTIENINKILSKIHNRQDEVSEIKIELIVEEL